MIFGYMFGVIFTVGLVIFLACKFIHGLYITIRDLRRGYTTYNSRY